MCRKNLCYKYNDFIVFLKNNNFIDKRDKNNLFYVNNNLIIKIDDISVKIEDTEEYRRYNFNNDTSNTFLINFISYLGKITTIEIS